MANVSLTRDKQLYQQIFRTTRRVLRAPRHHWRGRNLHLCRRIFHLREKEPSPICDPAPRWDSLVLSLGELLDQLRIERVKIGWSAGRNQPVIHVDLFVHPLRPSVLEVSLQRWVRGQGTATENVRVGQNPRTVADHRERLSSLDMLLHNLDRCLVHAQLVGVSGTALEG